MENKCFAFKHGKCDALEPKAYYQMFDEGKCGNLGCPFFKTHPEIRRIGDTFTMYTRAQLEIMRLCGGEL